MSWVGCLPWVYQPYYETCVESMHPDFRKHVLEIENVSRNRGIMKSHNMGVDKLKEADADWLVVMSASVRFWDKGGMDFIEELDKHPDALLLHGSGWWYNKGADKRERAALGWHLTAFRKEVFDTVGNWDENFTPYGLDDTDLTLRMLKGFGDRYKIEVVDVDMLHSSTSHSINLANVKSSYPPRNEYFKRKWGRDGGDWQNDGYPTPFNLDKPLSYWPEPDDPLSIYQTEYKNGYNFND